MYSQCSDSPQMPTPLSPLFNYLDLNSSVGDLIVELFPLSFVLDEN